MEPMLRMKKKPALSIPAQLADMLRLTRKSDSSPNINELWQVTKDLEAMKLTVKFFGYELAKALLAGLPPLPPGGPFQTAMTSRASTQADLEASWTRYWSAQLRGGHAIHRRTWENAYVLQAIAQMGKLRPGMKGLVVGGGNGPLVAYLASKGCEITVIDSTAPSADGLFKSELVDRQTYDRNVKVRAVDLNALPQDLRDFDFCCSISRIHMLGSIANGLAFMESMIDVLKTSAMAVHTTEFAFAADDQTIDNWSTVLFQRRHFEDMSRRLAAKGCRVSPLDFNLGNRPLDRFIDVPPFDLGAANLNDWSHDTMHIKASIDGFPCTSFGLITVKNV